MIKKIIKFFDKINRPVIMGSKKYLVDGEINISPAEYAVIYSGEDIMLCDKKNEKSTFEEKEEIGLSAYCGEYFLNSERLLKILKKERYELIYENNRRL